MNEARLKPKRTRFSPTDSERQACAQMSGYGLPQASIARLIRNGISLETLQRHFHDELQTGKAKAHARATQTLYSQAIGGNIACLLFYLKTQLGFRETNHLELTGTDGAPLMPAVSGVLLVPA